jgi:hypothetical protein
MCIPALSSNFESYGVSELSEKRRTEFRLFLLSKFKLLSTCGSWLKLLPRLKVGLSGISGEAKFCQVTLLNICLVPGTEGTGKTSTCLFGVAMWQTHCLSYLGVCSFHKIELQLTLYHTNPTSLVHLFKSPKVFWRSIGK